MRERSRRGCTQSPIRTRPLTSTMSDVQRIPELRVVGKPLGRHIKHDPRSLDYPAEQADELKSAWHYTKGLPLDQGDIGSCTGNALAGCLNTQPNHQKTSKLYTEHDAVQLYEWETADEGQP